MPGSRSVEYFQPRDVLKRHFGSFENLRSVAAESHSLEILGIAGGALAQRIDFLQFTADLQVFWDSLSTPRSTAS